MHSKHSRHASKIPGNVKLLNDLRNLPETEKVAALVKRVEAGELSSSTPTYTRPTAELISALLGLNDDAAEEMVIKAENGEYTH